MKRYTNKDEFRADCKVELLEANGRRRIVVTHIPTQYSLNRLSPSENTDDPVTAWLRARLLSLVMNEVNHS